MKAIGCNLSRITRVALDVSPTGNFQTVPVLSLPASIQFTESLSTATISSGSRNKE
jgi:hypothetical protein